MKTAVYMRVSTEEQREKQTIETQRVFAQRYCAANSIEVVEWYADARVRGTVRLDERPEGSRMLDDARRGKFQRLLLFKLDRLGREAVVTMTAVHELKKLGVQVVSLNEPFNTEDPTGEFLMTILAGFASFERSSIITRSIEGTNGSRVMVHGSAASCRMAMLSRGAAKMRDLPSLKSPC